jgi:uncharacterized protein YukE
VLSCASRPLSVIWRGQSGEDFHEVVAQDKLQMTAFQLETKEKTKEETKEATKQEQRS